MSGTSYSQDQIEQKRLLALKRKAEKESKNHNAGSSNVSSNCVPTQSKQSREMFASIKVSSNGSPTQSKHSREMSTSSNGKLQDLSRYKYDKGSPGAMRTPKKNNRLSPLKAKNFFPSGQVINGQCTMISESRFLVDVPYNQPLVELFKTIPSRLYDQKARLWNFDVNDHEKLIAACMPLRPQVMISSIPRYVLQMLKANANKENDIESVDWSRVDGKLRESLMPFQREGISYGISKKGRCLIADDMGLGKTIQALGLAHYYREDWPLLIVTPSSVRYQWSEAIYNFLPSVPIHYIHHFTSGKDYVGNSKITIVSYDLLVRSIETFERRIYGFVILDESHFVKSGKAARTKAVQRITAQARRVVLLTGTPALSRPIELYSQISLIVPTFMGYHDYGLRYCDGVKKTFGWDYTGSAHMQELQLLLKACCLIRRLKTDVLKQLPSKIRQVVILDPALVKKLSKGTKEIADKLESKHLSGSERHNAILEYYHESSDRRIKAVCNYVTDLLENGQKFLIYAHHQCVLDAISELLQSKGVRYIRIDGKTSGEHRKQHVDTFQETDDCLVAVLSITAANAGITLTAAQLVVFAELFWNPGILCQAEDRVHRIGQVFSVVIQYLVARGTADDHLWPLIQKKIGVLNKVGLDQNFSLNEADVSEQKCVEEATSTKVESQMKMDSFVTATQSSTESETANPEGQAAAQMSEPLDDYLDDVNFDDIDLDNIA